MGIAFTCGKRWTNSERQKEKLLVAKKTERREGRGYTSEFTPVHSVDFYRVTPWTRLEYSSYVLDERSLADLYDGEQSLTISL